MQILSHREFDIKADANNLSHIILNGEKKNNTIEGSFLEFCLKHNGQYLVFMTDDIPSEDTLHIHLLDEKLTLIDSANIGSMYATGSFKNPVIENQNKITFNFIGNTRWAVELLAKKEMRLPFISSLKGISRKYPFSQYFKVYGNPESERTQIRK